MYSFKKRLDPLIIITFVLLIIRALIFLGLVGICFWVVFVDLTSPYGYLHGIYVLGLICGGLSVAIISLDILSIVKLFENQLGAKIIPIVISIFVSSILLLMLILDKEFLILLIPISFNLAILLFCLRIKLNPYKYSVPLGQPVFEVLEELPTNSCNHKNPQAYKNDA